ncbi:Phospho-N-acetylmuramoyl-pentapeptide-transferase [subsurface metagenome]
MGDTGSLALGAGLAAVAVLSGHWLLLPLVGAIFVVIALSVIVQVGYFKYSRRKYGEGRRVFRMAPLQHHLELGGWSEVQITSRFWVVAAVAAAVGVGLGIAR